MINFDEVLSAFRQDLLKIAQLERERLDLSNSSLPAAMRDERDQLLKNEIASRRPLLERVLNELVEFPPQHVRHRKLLSEFHKIATFERSVFVMTKFPDPKNPASVNVQLETVIQSVRDAVKSCGYVARVAGEDQYHSILWDNVELYLLGCKRGIAIVEDKYIPELNPNVAMEWEWMRGMGRSVLYLIEKEFQKQRADWAGLIEHQFDWANPGPDVKAGVETWLKDSR